LFCSFSVWIIIQSCWCWSTICSVLSPIHRFTVWCGCGVAANWGQWSGEGGGGGLELGGVRRSQFSDVIQGLMVVCCGFSKPSMTGS
jgi:hypothetical protein